MRTAFVAPHHDDETLFGAFTLIREKPQVVVVMDGGREREMETELALHILGCDVAEHWGVSKAELMSSQKRVEYWLSELHRYDHVYAPAFQDNGHAEHNLISQLCAKVLRPKRVTYYMTYTQNGPYLKRSEGDVRVTIEDGEWVERKLHALLCYRSQIVSPPDYPSWVPFIESQWEWYAG